MNLATKIYKLKRAVWEYRGRYNAAEKKWIKPPKTSVKNRVIIGLQRLGIDAEKGMEKVDAFKDGCELDFWIAEIRQKRKLKNDI